MPARDQGGDGLVALDLNPVLVQARRYNLDQAVEMDGGNLLDYSRRRA